MKRIPHLLASLAVLALATAACGGDDEAAPATDGGTAPSSVAAAPTAPSVPDTAPATAPATMPATTPESAAPTSAVATAPETTAAPAETGPAPEPLAERETIKVGVPAPLETLAPLFVGQALGEFDAENLDVEIVNDTVPNLFLLLGQGQIDVMYGGPQAAALNALGQGVEIRWVAGAVDHTTSEANDHAGLYVSTRLAASADGFDPASLAGHSVGVGPGGFGAPSVYPLYEVLTSAGLGVDDVTVTEFFDLPSFQTALESGGVDAILAAAPLSIQLEQAGTAVLVQRYTTPAAAYFSSAGMIADRHDAAVAFFRAMQRTIDTYLSPGYHQVPDVAEPLAAALGVPADLLVGSPEYTYDLSIDPDALDRFIEMYQAAGKLAVPVEVAETFVDTSIVDEARS